MENFLILQEYLLSQSMKKFLMLREYLLSLFSNLIILFTLERCQFYFCCLWKKKFSTKGVSTLSFYEKISNTMGVSTLFNFVHTGKIKILFSWFMKKKINSIEVLVLFIHSSHYNTVNFFLILVDLTSFLNDTDIDTVSIEVVSYCSSIKNWMDFHICFTINFFNEYLNRNLILKQILFIYLINRMSIWTSV